MKYIKPDIEVYVMEASNGFLKGSVTPTPVKVGSVTVEEFQDGFADSGGFQEISFD